MKKTILFLCVSILSPVALAQNNCVQLNGCYLNTAESSGGFKSIIRAESSCGGAFLATGKMMTIDRKTFALPDRSENYLSVLSNEEQTADKRGTYKTTIDDKTVTTTYVIQAPPGPPIHRVVRHSVVEVGGQACGKTVSVRTLVEEDERSCAAYPAISDSACLRMVGDHEPRTIARCEGRGTKKISERVKKPFKFKAHLKEQGSRTGNLEMGVFQEFEDGTFEIQNFENWSIRAEADAAKGLVMNVVWVDMSEWHREFPLTVNPKTWKSGQTTLEVYEGYNPFPNPFDTITCTFDQSGMKK